MATDSLFILSLHLPVGSQSITWNLKRERERERETEDKSSEERQREGTRTEQSVEIYFCCPVVCDHTQGDKCIWEASGISPAIMETVN